MPLSVQAGKYYEDMKAQYTSGPWAWQRFGDTYYLTAQHGMREVIIGAIPHGEMKYPVVGMNLDGVLRDVDPDHPNAQLIASAPELLKALEDAYRFIDHLRNQIPKGEWSSAMEAGCYVMNKAINKARGQ